MNGNEQSSASRMRRQGRILAVAAVGFVILGIADALPAAIKRKTENRELLDLQAAIVNTQAQIRDVQAKILETRAQIALSLNAHRN